MTEGLSVPGAAVTVITQVPQFRIQVSFVVTRRSYESSSSLDDGLPEFFAVEPDFAPRVAGEDDFVAFLDAEGGRVLPVSRLLTLGSEDLARVWAFHLAVLGEDDAGFWF